MYVVLSGNFAFNFYPYYCTIASREEEEVLIIKSHLSHKTHGFIEQTMRFVMAERTLRHFVLFRMDTFIRDTQVLQMRLHGFYHGQWSALEEKQVLFFGGQVFFQNCL